ncbi:MAG: FixH family protein [Calditrichaceae bacterium]|nr:FixH family protein [Calditrichaceae bacterium]
MTKNAWPIGLTIVFIVFFLYLTGFIVLSQMNRSDLVTDNYYDEEIAYQDQIERIERSRKLNQQISLNHDIQNKIVELQFPSEIDPHSISGNILFFRPSDAKQDQIHPIRLNNENIQIINVKHLTKGMWRLKIFWQLNREEYYDEKILTIE